MKIRPPTLIMVLSAALCLGLTGVVLGSSTDNHSVTVQVLAINEVAIIGGAVTLTINSATAGSDPDDAVDNTTCDLDWTTNEIGKKITVQTDLADQHFTLKVVAQNVTGGVPAPEATLNNTDAKDFVTKVNVTTGGCDIQYTGSATAAAGTGNDVHTVTYTIITAAP